MRHRFKRNTFSVPVERLRAILLYHREFLWNQISLSDRVYCVRCHHDSYNRYKQSRLSMSIWKNGEENQGLNQEYSLLFLCPLRHVAGLYRGNSTHRETNVVPDTGAHIPEKAQTSTKWRKRGARPGSRRMARGVPPRNARSLCPCGLTRREECPTFQAKSDHSPTHAEKPKALASPGNSR